MVLAYGAIETGVANRSPEADNNESSALLGNEAIVKPREGHATVISSVSNLANTIIGSGMLTFPLAMAAAGLIPGMVTCAICGAVSAFGLYLISRCARYTPHRQSSFFAVSQITFPQAAVLLDAAVAIKCFGVSVSYLIIIKSLIPNVVTTLLRDLTSPDTNPPEWALSGHNWITLLMFFIGPLSFLRKLDSLRYTSYVAMFSVAYLVIIVVSCYFRPLDGTPPAGEIHLIHFTPTFVTTFPVQVFAFTCGQNMFPIYNELRSNTQERLNTVIGTSILGAVTVYEVIGVFGYLTFGSNVGANIVAMYPSSSLFVAIGQLAIVILITFSYPLQVHPCCRCLDKIFRGKTVAGRSREEGASDEIPVLKHAILTGSVVLLGFMIAYSMDDLQMVLSIVGSTGSATVSYILPGLMFWKLSKDDVSVSRTLNRGALGLAVYGCSIFVFCLGFNVYQIVHAGSKGLADVN